MGHDLGPPGTKAGSVQYYSELVPVQIDYCVRYPEVPKPARLVTTMRYKAIDKTHSYNESQVHVTSLPMQFDLTARNRHVMKNLSLITMIN